MFNKLIFFLQINSITNNYSLVNRKQKVDTTNYYFKPISCYIFKKKVQL